MTRHLELDDILDLHRLVVQQSGGSAGVRDFGALLSAIAQPASMFGDAELYPSLAEKAAAVSFSLIKNHPFIDGNKRVGHAAMETFLSINGYELAANVDEQEEIILKVADGTLRREEFTTWVQAHLISR